MKKRVAIIFLILVCAAVAGHAEEITWSGRIKPLFDRLCAGCHGADTPEYAAFKKDKDSWVKKGVGMRMDSYGHLISFVGWPNTGALMRRLDDGKNTKDGKPGNMYQHLGATEEDRQQNLTFIKSWVGNWSLKRWQEVTKDELGSIRVTY